jgi:predicted aspartyl protease
MPARLSALGALLFLLPWGFGLIPGVANADCKLATVADFHADKSGGAPIIDGTVNGQPIKIVVDAGSSKTLFTSAAAKRLGLITTRLTGGTFAIGGDDRASMTAVKELTIDRLKLSNITLGVVVGPDRPRGFDMLLGDDLLSHYDVEFDLANSAVRLFEAQGCQPPQLVYWAKPYSQATLLSTPRDNPRITAEVELNGHRMVAEIDTGSSETIVDTVAAGAAGVSRGSPGSEAAGKVHGIGPVVEDSFAGKFSSFAFGDEKLANTRLVVADFARSVEYTPTGSTLARPVLGAPMMLIGDDFLRAHRVMVANREHVILFSYNGGPVFTVAAPDVELASPPR